MKGPPFGLPRAAPMLPLARGGRMRAGMEHAPMSLPHRLIGSRIL